MTNSLYEQLKDDLGYLGLHRSAECFATLAEEAKTQEWSHIEFLARVVGEQAAATVNRKLAARLRFARFPFRRTLADFDFEFQPTLYRKLLDDLATLRFIEDNRPSCSSTSLGAARPIVKLDPPVPPGQEPGLAPVARRDSKTHCPPRQRLALLWICPLSCQRRPGSRTCWPD